jgi:hypothetical protein
MNGLQKLTTANVLLFILFWCVFSFKFQLGGVAEAGFRPDDLLIAVAFLVLLLKGAFTTTALSRPFKLYSLFAGVSVVSSLINGYAGRVATLYSILFDVRLIEYMLFYFIGYYLYQYNRQRSVTRMMVFYLYLMLIIVPLQMVRIVPVVTGFGYLRAVGNTNGPYEFAAVASFLLCYLGYRKNSFFKGFTSSILVFASASRVTSVGVVISLYSYLFRRSRKSLQASVFAGAALLITVSGLVLLETNTEFLADSDISLFTRLGSVASSNTVSDFIELYPTAPTYTDSTSYLLGTFEHSCDFNNCLEGQGDVSAKIRVFRWTALIKSTVSSGEAMVIGLGPSFASAAVDGYYVRVFTETGLIGLAIFFYFLASFWMRAAKEQWPFREFILIMIISGCFIDIFTSYKPMILLWLWHGMNEAELKFEQITLEEENAIHAGELSLASS